MLYVADDPDGTVTGVGDRRRKGKEFNWLHRGRGSAGKGRETQEKGREDREQRAKHDDCVILKSLKERIDGRVLGMEPGRLGSRCEKS